MTRASSVENCEQHYPGDRTEHFHDPGEGCTDECYTVTHCIFCGETL